MALTECKECGKVVSFSADKCPYCGVNHPGVTAKWYLIFIGLAVFGLVALFSGGESKKAPADSPPVAVRSQAQPQQPAPKTIGITYNQTMEYLDQYISMALSSDVWGQARYMGQTSDNCAMLEVVGNKDDVTQATLMIGLPKDAPKIILRNTAILLRFMKNIAPEWELGSDWVTSAIKRVASTGESEEIIKGSKSIELSLLKDLGIVSVTVKHKVEGVTH